MKMICCISCEKEKAENEFYQCNLKKRYYICKKCKNLKNKESQNINLKSFYFCRKCQKEKNKDSFSEKSLVKYDFICKDCAVQQAKEKYSLNKNEILAQQKLYQQNKSRHKEQQLKRLYNLNLEQFQALKIAQNNVCAICSNSPKNNKELHVDHCHKTGKIRRLLCSRCNLLLGMVDDDCDLIKKFLKYLEENNG